MIVTSHLFEAFLECSTKCWLRARAEPTAGNAYAEWARTQNKAYYEHAVQRLLAILPGSDCAIAPTISRHPKGASWRFAIDVCLRTNNLETRLQAVKRMPSAGRGKTIQFVPYRFDFANKINKNHKLSLAFDALVLAGAVGREVTLGKIIHGDDHTALNVKLSSLARDAENRIKDITALLADDSPPDLVMNRHCGQCEFKDRCRKQALEKDELSLLSRISEKERKQLRGKGIFTVTQLSYTFRPRRRRRELHGKQQKFHHSLQALAIRENKIHIVDITDPKVDGTHIYLDIEGLPDRDFYYLIGVRVGTGDDAVQYGLWANDKDGERRIWNQFLEVLSAIPSPRLIHYGSYETIFFKRMSQCYGGLRDSSPAATAINDAVNLLSFVFARIYFPTFSNGLKEIAEHLGFRWAGSLTSGSLGRTEADRSQAPQQSPAPRGKGAARLARVSQALR